MKGEFDKVVLNYKKVKALIANTSVTMFKNILFEVESIIKSLRTQLFKSLSNVTVGFNEQVKIIRSTLVNSSNQKYFSTCALRLTSNNQVIT
jgi:hypothetical protein